MQKKEVQLSGAGACNNPNGIVGGEEMYVCASDSHASSFNAKCMRREGVGGAY